MLPSLLLLLAAPAIAGDHTTDDAKAMLAAAIERGAPLYNQGSPQGCAAVYEVAAVALVRFGSEELSEADRRLLADTLAILPADADARAWTLRRSFDAVLGAGPRPELPGVPTRVSGPDAPTVAGVSLPVDGVWNEVDDRVMGGISRGSARVEAGRMIWSGRMTTASNGGFVTTRTAFDALDLSEAAGLVFRVRGDGRTYRATLNTDERHSRGIGMAQLRTVAGEWVDIRVPFSAFNGRMYGGTRAFDPRAVRSVQVQLAGADQVGDYQLEIASITAFNKADGVR